MLKITFENGKKLEIDPRPDPRVAKTIIALAVQACGKILLASHIEPAGARPSPELEEREK